MGANVSLEKYPTVPERLRVLAQEVPDRELFIFHGPEGRKSLTAQEVYTLGGVFASRLRSYGFRKRDVIANMLPNCPERLISDVGIILAGCVTMNGQVIYKEGKDFFLNCRRSGCVGVIMICDDHSKPWDLLKDYLVDWPSSGLAQMTCEFAPNLCKAVLVSRQEKSTCQPFLQDLTYSDEPLLEAEVEADDILMIFATSGSTGNSKLIPRTHAQTFAIELIVDQLKQSQRIWRALVSEQCAYAMVHVPQIEHIVSSLHQMDTPPFKLKYLGLGGQPVRKHQFQKCFLLGHCVTMAYACSEAGYMACATIYPGDSVPDDFFCGKPSYFGTEVKVLDPQGKPVPVGQTGNIYVKGPGLFSGYLNIDKKTEQNAAVFTADGFLDLGDLGHYDHGGNLYVSGRTSDVIMHGTHLVYPDWIETKLLEHPRVATALVVPVSDPVYFHKICAYVQPTPGNDITEEELRKFNEGGKIKAELPVVPTGKPDRQAIRSLAEKMFGRTQPGDEIDKFTLKCGDRTVSLSQKEQFVGKLMTKVNKLEQFLLLAPPQLSKITVSASQQSSVWLGEPRTPMFFIDYNDKKGM
ncbi:2-succinylbenzoate--CoA ligase [Aplysia californica]|uniref:2-succinylbenzoate--CoA ligase n=1 Tax=Aplysia californica TaxID=6500 RepID=A0ABM0JKT3_APLCA|nr:2-succinylbenzoate--CoA ligase [Aplysia californica]